MDYKVAYLDRANRAYLSNTFSLDTAKRAMGALKRRGFTAWIEDASGTFVPVPGAKRRPTFLAGAPMMAREEGATGGFVRQHPWMTFFVVLAGISTVGAVLGANRV